MHAHTHMVFRGFSMGFPCAPRSEGRDDGTTAGSAAAVALPAGPLVVALVPQGTVGRSLAVTADMDR